MINIQNKKNLENIFANDFGSPYFPILAELYMNEGDLDHAKKVCKIGLEHDINNDCGKVILAKIAMIEEKPTVSEKWLKQAVSNNSANFVALRMLIRIEFILKRNLKTILNYVNVILSFLPNDVEANNWLKNFPSMEPKTTTNNQTLSLNVKSNIINKTKQNLKNYAIEESMATLTMLRVLKKQKSYQQALLVINMLESKNIALDLINKERKEILALIKINNAN